MKNRTKEQKREQMTELLVDHLIDEIFDDSFYGYKGSPESNVYIFELTQKRIRKLIDDTIAGVLEINEKN